MSSEPTEAPPVEVKERTRKFGPRTDALQTIEDVDLAGKTMLITGTTAGIGTETARALALRGAHIVMANRNILQSEELKNKILEEKSIDDPCCLIVETLILDTVFPNSIGIEPDAKVDLITCDLSSLQSVQAAAEEFKSKHWPLHVLILNAGVFAPVQKMTFDGLETCFGVNHVAHHYLIRELLPVLRQTEHSRIVIVASTSHTHTGLTATQSTEEKVNRICPKDSSELSYKLYAYSKLCNVLTAFRLHRTENPQGISVYALHPGTMIGTSISRGYGVLGKLGNILFKPFTKTVSQGAATTVYCSASPEVAGISGKYWMSCWDDEKELQPELARDEALQDALWERTEKIIDDFEEKRQQKPNAAVST